VHRFISLLLICSAAAGAETVFRSVDENGVVTFSDTPPAGDVQAETLRIDTPGPQDPQAYEAQLDSMRETTDRMVADRMARERHRAELREIEARTEAYQAPPEPVYDPTVGYAPVYTGRRYPGHYRPPWRPGFHPRPEPPIARPPLRPGHPGRDPNDQLMRPIVSPRDAGAGSNNAQLMRPIVSPPRR
jgi:hypothetical protein